MIQPPVSSDATLTDRETLALWLEARRLDGKVEMTFHDIIVGLTVEYRNARRVMRFHSPPAPAPSSATEGENDG